MRRLFVALFGLLLAACSGEREAAPAFHPTDNPQNLSDWGVIQSDGKALTLSDGVTPYDLATPLFSDYAQKLRTVWMPEGMHATYDANNAFDFPVGTIVTKTFYYPVTEDGAVVRSPVVTYSANLLLENIRLIETRILVRREDGWHAVPYLWNEDQTDAQLKRTGAIIPIVLQRADGRREDFAYLVPNANQCAACHATNATTKAIQPIGLKARHLNKQSTFNTAFNQLDYWLASGLLSNPPHPEETGDAGRLEGQANFPMNADWRDETAPLDARARAYLDINCSHCHNPVGAADTSGLNLEPDATGPALGRCKVPIAAGSGSGGRPFDIAPGEPDRSITLFRMETTDPGAMMPELGRAVTHEEGAQLIREWIAGLDGSCGHG